MCKVELSKRVGNASFGRLEIQSYGCQPFFRLFFEFEQGCQIFVENDEVIGIANDGWFTGLGQRFNQCCFHTV